MKILTIKGRKVLVTNEYSVYDCGTYFVRIDHKKSLYYLSEMFEHKIFDIKQVEKALKGPLKRLSKKCKNKAPTSSALFDDMEKCELGIFIEGSDINDCYNTLWNNVSFSTFYEGGNKASQEWLESIKSNENLSDKYKYILTPSLLPERAYDIYMYLLKRTEIISKYPKSIIHNKSNYKHYYNTLETLENVFTNMTSNEIIMELQFLYINNCLTLYDKKPKHKASDTITAESFIYCGG